MSLLQWGAEPADTQTHARTILREPEAGADHHVLMVEGVVDNYILPPIANPTALSIGLDLAGPQLDSLSDELSAYAPLASVLDLSGRAAVSLPCKET